MERVVRTIVQISVRTRYALCALIDLNINQHTGNVKLKDVSERQNIPLKYLEQIVQILSKAGLVKGERGPNGGYVLSKPAESVSVGDVIFALEGSQGIESAFDKEYMVSEGTAQHAVYVFWKETETELDEKIGKVTIADLSETVRPNAYIPADDLYYI